MVHTDLHRFYERHSIREESMDHRRCPADPQAHATTAERSEGRSMAGSVTGRTPNVSGLDIIGRGAFISVLPFLIISRRY